MAESKTVVRSGGLSLSAILLILFIVLKVTGHITWSWFWVLAPMWIPWALVLGILLVVGVVFLIAGR
jgi:hypothetical protein